MAPPSTVPERDFIRVFEEKGAEATAKLFGISVRAVYDRRIKIENKIGRQLISPNNRNQYFRPDRTHSPRIEIEVKDGVVLVGSDGHYWPGPPSTAHRAFVRFCKELKPKAVVMNGDAFDGSRISRHAPIMHEDNPTVVEELEAVQERLGEIEAATFRCPKLWPLGNHDARFESRLATVAPDYARVHGFHLKDHTPHWQPCWAVWINGNVVIKHRFKGGIHATHNNTLHSGATTITGHLHSLKVTPFSDYNGTRWGVDTGCLADPYGPQFAYQEDSPRNHRSGFIVLTFRQGRLLWPEVVNVFDKDRVEFRGELTRV